MAVQNFKELDVWKKGIDIVDAIYDLTERFPKKELYGLSGQMQRAAVSVPSNIAEGFRRAHTKEYMQFLHVALGSCAELETQLVIAYRRRYINDKDFNSLQDNIDHEGRMVMNMLKHLREKL